MQKWLINVSEELDTRNAIFDTETSLKQILIGCSLPPIHVAQIAANLLEKTLQQGAASSLAASVGLVLVITWFVGLLRINCPRKI